jgi:hypothetical protein
MMRSSTSQAHADRAKGHFGYYWADVTETE